MSKTKTTRRARYRLPGIILSLAMVMGMAVTLVAPMLTQTASAADQLTMVNMFARGFHTESGTRAIVQPIEVRTCVGKFQNYSIDNGFLDTYVGPVINSIGNQDPAIRDQQTITTYLGQYSPTDPNGSQGEHLSKAQIDFLFSTVAAAAGTKQIPAIHFTSQPDLLNGTAPINGGLQTGGTDFCDGLIMVPVSTTEWRGYQQEDFTNPPSGTYTPYKYMKFTIDPSEADASKGIPLESFGKFTFYSAQPDGVFIQPQTANKFVIYGDPDWTGTAGNSVAGTLTLEWIDQSQLKITGWTPSANQSANTPNHTGEIYKMSKWQAIGGKSYFFLHGGVPAGSARLALLDTNGRMCDTDGSNGNQVGGPLPPGTNCTGGPGTGATNCVPFIVINHTLAFDTNTPGGFGGQIDAMFRANTAAYYDYNNGTDCLLNQGTFTANSISNPGTRSEAWFYYSTSADAFAIVFPSGKTAESIFIGGGTYPKNTGTSGSVYTGGADGCDASLRPTIPDFATKVLFTVNWELDAAPVDCKSTITPLTTVQVQAFGGTDGEQGFQAISGLISDAGNSADTNSVAQLNCDVTFNPLTWIMCPILAGAQAAIEQLDNAINSLLTVNVDKYFDETCNSPDAIRTPDNTRGGPCVAAKFYTVWNNFRVLAIALIVISAFVMVIAQALGAEIASAYAVKKMLPAMVVAAPLIIASWPLGKDAIHITETIGLGVRDFIYSPFADATGAVNVGQGVSSALAIAGSGALLALGIFGALTLVLTAFLAVLVGFAILGARQLGIIVLMLVMPFVIACSILPFTKKVFKVGAGAFAELLLAFIVISAVIAASRDMASASASTHDVFFGVLALLFYFGPYFAMGKLITLTGGVMGTIGNLASKSSAGLFGGLQNIRKREMASRRERGGRRVLQKRADWASNLQERASSNSTNWLARRGLRMAAKGLGGYNVEAAMSARRSAVGKEVNDQINAGRDEEVRGLTVDRRLLRNFAAAQASGRARVDPSGSGKRQYKSLGGAWVDEAHVAAGHARWGHDTFAQQAALSYEERKAASEEDTQHIAQNYARVAESWGMSDTQAGGAWIGAAFENQNQHLEFKSTNWRDGTINQPTRLVDEIYERRGSYNMAQMSSNTIESLKAVYNDPRTTADAREKIAAIAETFMQEYSTGGIATGGGDLPPEVPGGAGGASRRTAQTPGAAHVAERVLELAQLVRSPGRPAGTSVYGAAPTGTYPAGHAPTPNDRGQKTP